MRFFISHGSLFLRHNGQLLYHGCVPMTAEGEFAQVTLDGKTLSGASLFDFIDQKARDAWYLEYDSPGQVAARDFLWYLWCGPMSPIFGKDRMATFERTLIEDKNVSALFLNRGTPHTEAILPLLDKHGVVLVAPSTGAMVLHQPVRKYIFNVRATYQREAEKAITHLASMGISRVALV